MEKIITIICTVPDFKTGKDIGEKLVSENLISCVNIIPGITSIYRWQGKICSDNEVILFMKSRLSLFDKIDSRVQELHPYDVPEVISMDIDNASNPYHEWILEMTK